MSTNDGVATFTLADCLLADRQGYSDGFLAATWAIEAGLRRGMPWPFAYRSMMAFVRGPLKQWAESANGDVAGIPPVPDWSNGYV